VADDTDDKLAGVQAEIFQGLTMMRGSKAAGPRQEDMVRIKNPGKALSADYEKSRANAIDLFCYTCVGGSKKEAADCRSPMCFLWPFRPNATSTVRPPGVVPTLPQYERLLDAKTSDAQREAGNKLAQRNRKPGAEPGAEPE
jgi:hypothetical protein